MARRRRRRLLVWALLLAGGWWAMRLLRAPGPPPPAEPAPEPPEATVAETPRARRPVAPRARRVVPASPRRSGVRPGVIAGVALVMLTGGVVAALGVRADSGPHEAPPLWSLAIGEPAAGSVVVAAPVIHATHALSRPASGSPSVAPLEARTPEGSRNVVLLADAGQARGTGRWVRVRLSGADAATGWVPRAVLGRPVTVRSHLYIDRQARRLTLVRDGRVALQAPVGVGTAGAPTPVGEFHVRTRLTRYASAFYGPVALGLSATTSALSDWPVAGSIGIHGTNRPQLVPGSVSRGSVWLRNPDVRRLARLVPMGTPVTSR